MSPQDAPDGGGSLTFTIDKPKLVALLAIELLGVAVVAWGLVELYYLGGNPVRPSLLIPVGSVIVTSGSVFFAKIYDGPGLMGMGSIDYDANDDE